MRTLIALPAGTPSLRLLADETAKVLAGIAACARRRWRCSSMLLAEPPARRRSFRLSVPDWLPALVNAARAFVAIGAVELFWVVTAWPNGASAMCSPRSCVLLLSPRGDLAYAGAIAFALGTVVAVVCAAIIKFAVLPGLQTFPAFCLALGLYLVPAGFAMAHSRRPLRWPCSPPWASISCLSSRPPTR